MFPIWCNTSSVISLVVEFVADSVFCQCSTSYIGQVCTS